MEKVVSSTRQRSSSLTNNDGKAPQFENEEDDDYSSSSDADNRHIDNDFSDDEDNDNQLSHPEETEDTDVPDPSSAPAATNAITNPAINDIAAAAIRQRSASVSPNAPRPIIDFDDVISGKLTPAKVHSSKKRSQTPQKPKRPTVLSTELFQPPPESPKDKLNSLSSVQGSMNLTQENISQKPLEELVKEVERVLTLENIKYRKRKNKYIWKCTYEIAHEPVQIELEITNVKNGLHGIMYRRIQGSFPGYQELYQKVKKELKI